MLIVGAFAKVEVPLVEFRKLIHGRQRRVVRHHPRSTTKQPGDRGGMEEIPDSGVASLKTSSLG